MAFGKSEGEAVAKLAINLLSDVTASPALSLIAEIDNEIAGHILFTSVQLEHINDSNAYILGPLAVVNDMQGIGVGTALIKNGLDRLKQNGADVILVYGDPDYYNRTGFKTRHHIDPPYPLQYPDAWMALELRDGVLDSIKGTIKCAESLNSPEYW